MVSPQQDRKAAMTPPRKAVLYMRVSTGGQTTENQRHDLEAAAKARGWQIVDVYRDAGISGSKGREKRPGLDSLMKDAVRGKFDAVLVWDTSRLARSVLHFAQVTTELDALGVVMVFVKEGVDTSTPHGRAMVQMSNVFAQLELSLIKERIKAGLDRAKRDGTRSGKPVGRPPASPQLHKAIRAAKAKGLSVRAIASKLATSVGTVHRSLTAA